MCRNLGLALKFQMSAAIPFLTFADNHMTVKQIEQRLDMCKLFGELLQCFRPTGQLSQFYGPTVKRK